MISDITKSGKVFNNKTVVSLGIFDGIHRGHQAVIRAAAEMKRQGLEFVLFTFKTDTVTTKGKGGFVEALLSDEIKKEHFEKMGADYLFSPEFDEMKNLTPYQFVEQVLHKRLNAAAVVCGEDFRFGKEALGDIDKLKTLGYKFGIRTVIVSQEKLNGRKISSTEIRECIRNGEIKQANEMLGYNYYYKLPVLHGNELGRTLDFPTINQEISKGQVIPKFGVYVTRTLIDGKWKPSVSNIGIKPTVEVRSVPLIETNIIDFRGDMYGSTVKVELLDFLRPEKKFESFDILKKQVHQDIAKAKEYFDLNRISN